MQQLNFVYLPWHLDDMCKVENVRHWLWYMLVQRNQGHLAHSVMAQGFLVVEFLRCCPCHLHDVSVHEFQQWKTAVEPLLKTLEASKFFLIGANTNPKAVALIDKTIGELNGLGLNLSRADFRFPESLEDPKTKDQEESKPCENARSQDVQESSSQASSAAHLTGIASPNPSNGESGTLTTSGGPEKLAPVLSGMSNPKSLRNAARQTKTEQRKSNKNSRNTEG